MAIMSAVILKHTEVEKVGADPNFLPIPSQLSHIQHLRMGRPQIVLLRISYQAGHNTEGTGSPNTSPYPNVDIAHTAVENEGATPNSSPSHPYYL